MSTQKMICGNMKGEGTFVCKCCDLEVPESNRIKSCRGDLCLICGWVETLDEHGAIPWRKKTDRPNSQGWGYIKLQDGIKYADWNTDGVFYYACDDNSFSVKQNDPRFVGWIPEEDLALEKALDRKVRTLNE